MMADNKKPLNLELDSYEDVMSSSSDRNGKNMEAVEIDIDLIDDFQDHPFHVVDNAEMQTLAQSIAEIGQLEPAKIRVKEDGRYEMISGHRRKFASTHYLHKKTMPCVILDISHDEATVMMVEANIQRTNISISEKAFALKMRKEAIERMKKDYVGGKNIGRGTKFPEYISGKSREIAGSEFGVNSSMAYRMIRLTYLPKEVLDKVDAGTIQTGAAVQLSYACQHSSAVAEMLRAEVGIGKTNPDQVASQQIRQLAENDELTPELLGEILHPEKPEKPKTPEKFALKGESVKRSIPGNLLLKGNEGELEAYVTAAIELYNKLESAATFDEFVTVAKAIYETKDKE